MMGMIDGEICGNYGRQGCLKPFALGKGAINRRKLVVIALYKRPNRCRGCMANNDGEWLGIMPRCRSLIQDFFRLLNKGSERRYVVKVSRAAD